MLIVHTNFNLCLKRLTILFALLCLVIFLFHPARFAVSYDYIETSEISRHLETVTPPDNITKPLCPINFSTLGIKTNGNLLDLKFNESEVKIGGRWEPPNCLAQHKVALIIPYRNRKQHLDTFINYIHGFLQAQFIEYSIYVVEQSAQQAFNRGLLFNIGYSWALQSEQIPCFIFHDVDLLPENLGNVYGCTSVPRHMSCSVNTLRYNLPYGTLFGGVVSMLQAQFHMVNGFPNRYFGWGGEDDDLFMRVINRGMNVVRFAPDISRYYMLPHVKESATAENVEHLHHVTANQDIDGLNDHMQYVSKAIEKPFPLYMLITVDLHLPEKYNKMEYWRK
ncbi:hypothetical protein FOCC_FOCC015480 [Frankliniella occidentalis]|uniref:Beta-1,4-N-acetylgalactosaminyltransferase n=1 Tax=Frankliniella occidentalis TaxID=133901 RepID=A0A6J1RZY0_FRAOC|nr:beta-1,4-galactosyltransferase 1-like [Frankliniella occidentalis]KAE8739035.1 hypothetical protein FOCC_FOCC015480 [Frankliniella occidentalis]